MDTFLYPIYRWYDSNRRNLPWRKTSDPYKIWLSEIILQQTRVAQGTEYYLRFIEAFPTVESLARAHEDEVLKLWQGLGYYSRARNLHFAAKTIVQEYNSVFPKTHQQILKLKGIGPYTAAAIASIAFHLPFPVVDGNVYRLLSRFYGISTPIDSNQGKREFQQLADELIFENKDPGFHNQALMEFGALQCIPKSPTCEKCPLSDLCYAFQNDQVEVLPVKAKKTKQRKRFFYYYMLDLEDYLVLEKRTSKDIWQNLFQFPLVETMRELGEEEIMCQELPFPIDQNFNIKKISGVKKHILSHQIIYARLIYIESNKDVHIPSPFIQVNKKDISKFAVPRLLELFIEDLKLNEIDND